MRSTSRLIIAFAALAMGCSDNPIWPNANPSSMTARRVWATNGLHELRSSRSAMDCFCAVNGPVRAVVVNDSVVTATRSSPRASRSTRAAFRRIKSLFDFIDRGIANHAAVLRVTYDPNARLPARDRLRRRGEHRRRRSQLHGERRRPDGVLERSQLRNRPRRTRAARICAGGDAPFVDTNRGAISLAQLARQRHDLRAIAELPRAAS